MSRQDFFWINVLFLWVCLCSSLPAAFDPVATSSNWASLQTTYAALSSDSTVVTTANTSLALLQQYISYYNCSPYIGVQTIAGALSNAGNMVSQYSSANVSYATLQSDYTAIQAAYTAYMNYYGQQAVTAITAATTALATAMSTLNTSVAPLNQQLANVQAMFAASVPGATPPAFGQ